MPRVAEAREPAVPSSPGQRERYRRILRAAAEHGATHGLDRIQMLDVAKDAGVAIATLYRYFPSKAILFTCLLRSQVENLDRMSVTRTPGQSVAEAVSRVLIESGRQLMQRPRLTQAMLQSNNAMVAGEGPTLAVTNVFEDLIMRVAGIEQPTALDRRLVRLLEQTWYGMLTSQLNGILTAADAEADVVLACQLLLADLGADAPTP